MIFNIGFKDSYIFRPGAILPEPATGWNTKLYNTLYVLARPLFPLMKRMNSVTTTVNFGLAMNHLYHTLKPHSNSLSLQPIQ